MIELQHITVELPAATLTAARTAASRDGDTLAEFVRATVEACLRRRRLLDKEPRRRLCQRCLEKHAYRGRRLCQRCYSAVYTPPLITCRDCGRERPHIGHGRCSACYERRRRRLGGKIHSRQIRACMECGKSRFIAARGLCGACYQRARRKAVA